jgi:hypothetical protein
VLLHADEAFPIVDSYFPSTEQSGVLCVVCCVLCIVRCCAFIMHTRPFFRREQPCAQSIRFFELSILFIMIRLLKLFILFIYSHLFLF